MIEELKIWTALAYKMINVNALTLNTLSIILMRRLKPIIFERIPLILV
jgi:hypothetical protein